MIGLNRKRTTKVSSKVRIFCLFLAVLFILSQVKDIEIVSAAEKVYVDKAVGANTNSGKSPEEAVKSLRKAKELLKGKGTIYVKVDDEWIELDAKQLKKGTNADKSDKVSAVVDEEVSQEKSATKAVTKEATKEAMVVDKSTSEVASEPAIEVATESEAEATAEPKPETVTEPESEATEPVSEDVIEVTPEVTPDVVAEETPEAPAKDDVAVSEETKTDEVMPEDNSQEKDSIEENTVGEKEDAEDNQEDIPVASEVAPEVTEDEMPVDEAKDSPKEDKVLEETEIQIEALAMLVGRTTLMVESASDFDNVDDATKAYEALAEEAKSQVPVNVYKRLRAAQIVTASEGLRTVSSPVEIVGNTGAVYEQSGTQSSGSGTSSSSASSDNKASGNKSSSNTSSGSSNTNKSTKSTNNTNSSNVMAAVRGIGVNTGDTNMILMTAGICLLAIAVIGGMIFLKKKKK